jgi:hypothetical protein
LVYAATSLNKIIGCACGKSLNAPIYLLRPFSNLLLLSAGRGLSRCGLEETLVKVKLEGGREMWKSEVAQVSIFIILAEKAGTVQNKAR